jgi:hypothetical protein
MDETQKRAVVEGYALGIRPGLLATQLGLTVGSIKTFHYRHVLHQDLPPRVIVPRVRVTDGYGHRIRDLALDSEIGGSRKISNIIKGEHGGFALGLNT